MNQAVVSKAGTVWLPSTLYLKIKLATTCFGIWIQVGVKGLGTYVGC